MAIKARIDRCWGDVFGIHLDNDNGWKLVTSDDGIGMYYVRFTFPEARAVVDALLPILEANEDALVAAAHARVESEDADKVHRETERRRLVDEQFDALESALGGALPPVTRHLLEQARISAKTPD